MNNLTLFCNSVSLVSEWILCGQSRLSSMGQRFSGEQTPTNWLPYLWLIILPVAAAIVLSTLYQYLQQRRNTVAAPHRLFRQLCQMHQLTVRQTRTLKTMADLVDATSPAELMVRPDIFRRAETAYREAHGERATGRIGALSDHLFAGKPAEQ
ncbi:hypothetical protein SH139x_004969 [Planctomycetaceae bacterium SH139]